MHLRSNTLVVLAHCILCCSASWLQSLYPVVGALQSLLRTSRRLSFDPAAGFEIESGKAVYESVEEQALDVLQRNHLHRDKIAPGKWAPPRKWFLAASPQRMIDAMIKAVDDPFTCRRSAEQRRAYHAATLGLAKDSGLRFGRTFNGLNFRWGTRRRAPVVASGLTSLASIFIPLSSRKILSVAQDSPAADAGLQVGDVLVSINGIAADCLPLHEIHMHLAPSDNVAVNVTVLRQGTEKKFTYTPLELHIPTVTHEVLSSGVGYIVIKQFSATTASELLDALKGNLRSCPAIAVDLRGNPGGIFSAGLDVAACFLPWGTPIAQIVRANGSIGNATSLNWSADVRRPLYIIVDEHTASASEIVAAALGEHGRAVVIGRPTFGKARVQAIHTLMDGSGLSLTIAEWRSPSGKTLQNGVQPTRLLPLHLMHSQLKDTINFTSAWLEGVSI